MSVRQPREGRGAIWVPACKGVRMVSMVTEPGAVEGPSYASYMLRLRWIQRDGEPVCQVMLMSVATKEQRFFTSLDEAVAHLRERRPEERTS